MKDPIKKHMKYLCNLGGGREGVKGEPSKTRIHQGTVMEGYFLPQGTEFGNEGWERESPVEGIWHGSQGSFCCGGGRFRGRGFGRGKKAILPCEGASKKIRGTSRASLKAVSFPEKEKKRSGTDGNLVSGLNRSPTLTKKKQGGRGEPGGGGTSEPSETSRNRVASRGGVTLKRKKNRLEW